MNQNKVHRHISEDRFDKYLQRCGNNFDKALILYEANTRLSQELYTVLNHYEIALRNNIHFVLTRAHGKEDWYNDWLVSVPHNNFRDKIYAAKNNLRRKREAETSGKIIAEFSLGFWTTMFNNNYDRLLWSDLRLCFNNIPRPLRTRRNIVHLVQKTRKFRNRVYHYEPILWNFNSLRENYDNVLRLIEWMDADLHAWVTTHCNFQHILTQTETQLIAQGIPT